MQQNHPSSSPRHFPGCGGGGCFRGKGSAFVGSISLPQASHIPWLWQPVGSVPCPGHQVQLGMWHIPLPPEALASCKDWGGLTCPKKRKGSRNVRPLHIQDWKPSAKDEGFCEEPGWAAGEGMEPSSSRRGGQGGSEPTPCLAEEVLPLQPHCGHRGAQCQGLLIQHRALVELALSSCPWCHRGQGGDSPQCWGVRGTFHV